MNSFISSLVSPSRRFLLYDYYYYCYYKYYYYNYYYNYNNYTTTYTTTSTTTTTTTTTTPTPTHHAPRDGPRLRRVERDYTSRVPTNGGLWEWERESDKVSDRKYPSHAITKLLPVG